jgi:hypothetical protein
MAHVILVLLVLGLVLLYLLPGLLALLLLKPLPRVSTWIALAFPVAVAIQIATECLLKTVTPAAHLPPTRLLATAATTLALFIAVVALRRRPPLRTKADLRVVLCALLAPLVFLALFGGAIFRHEPTSDGIEAIEMARSLDAHFLPRWPTESGLKGLGQGLVALAFPNAWLGVDDPFPRLSFLMFLAAIAAQIVALVEARRETAVGWIAAGAITASVVAAGATLGLHVSFDPYYADVASPAGAELMTVAMMLAAFVAFTERRTVVFLVAAVLAHATLPSGLLFVVVFGAAWFAVTRSRSALGRVGAAIGLCLVATLLYEHVYVPHALAPGATMDAGSESLASRVRLLIFTDWTRLAFLVIPCGIVPFFFLFFWKKQDAIASVATIVTAALFVFFAVLATYSPHYFAPAMVLALVPYWRWARSPLWLWIGLAGALAGLALSLPPFHDRPQPCREVGRTISVYADRGDSRRPGEVLQSLAHLPWDEVDPARSFVATGLQLAHESKRSEDSGIEPGRNWEVRPDSDAPEPGYQPVVSRGGWTLFARPGVKLEDVKERGWRTDFQAPWYRVPKEALFRGLTLKSGRYDLDLKKLFGRN